MSEAEYLNSPMFWLRRAMLAMHRAVQEELSRHDLTGAQFEVLRNLWRQDGMEQRTLQERLGVSSPTLTGVIDTLVERGLVERRQSPGDARVKQLFLTRGGCEVELPFADAMGRAEARLLQGFSPSERRLLADWLQRMAANMGISGDCCDE
jgi:MarR family transcriptional regulator for hemolysin